MLGIQVPVGLANVIGARPGIASDLSPRLPSASALATSKTATPLAARLKSDHEKYQKLVKISGAKVE